MAKIVDPDQLNQATEVVINTTAKTVQLLIAGNLDDNSPGQTSGVTKQCLYSFLKEEWKSDAALNKFKFPLKALYEAKFIWQNGWGPADAQTRDLIRDAGWQEIDDSEYACVISLGNQYDNTQQAWYQQVTGFDQTTTDFDKTGPLDEAVQIYDGGAGDYRDFLKVFLRTWERTYSDYNLLVEQNLAALTYIAYRLPLANENDIKNDGSVTQAFIDGANDPYQDMELQYYVGNGFTTAAAQSYSVDDVVQDGVGRWARCTGAGTVVSPGGGWAAFGGTSTWEAYPGERQIGTNYYAFNRAVKYTGVSTYPTRAQIYLFVQNELTKTGNINDDGETEGYGTVNGNVAVPLAYYVGDQVYSWPGVFFDNFNANDTNDIFFNDITVDGGGLDTEDVPVTSTARNFPFVAAGNMVFNTDLVNDADAEYWMYFKNANGNQYDDATAIIVDNNAGADITGSIGVASISFDFDYDGNNQGGRTPGTDADVVVVAMGLNGAEWVIGEFTITRTTGLNFPVNAPTERTYINPV